MEKESRSRSDEPFGLERFAHFRPRGEARQLHHDLLGVRLLCG
jgi:hypothetical protein